MDTCALCAPTRFCAKTVMGYPGSKIQYAAKPWDRVGQRMITGQDQGPHQRSQTCCVALSGLILFLTSFSQGFTPPCGALDRRPVGA